MSNKSNTNAAREAGQITFHVSRVEMDIINKIADRAVAMAKKHGVNYDKMTADMDVTACHANGCPLDLPKLLAADNFNFSHDIFGIARHINRSTGQLENCFVPRCAMPERSPIIPT
jgi:hypothetical protein